MVIILKPDGSSVDNIIKYMKVGEKGYISTRAIAFDLERKAYLNVNSFVEKNKTKGNERLFIIRTGNGISDYEIDLTEAKQSWTLEEKPFYDEYGPDFRDDIEAVQIPVALGYHTGKKVLSEREIISSKLEEAVRTENFELAAKLRDKLNRVSKNGKK